MKKMVVACLTAGGLLLGLCETSQAITMSDFALTTSRYNSDTADLAGGVAAEFGSGYRIADWSDLIAFDSGGGDIGSLWSGFGFADAIVSCNGEMTWAWWSGGRRQYYVDWSDRPGRSPFDNFLVHGNIDQLYLGSWSVNLPMLAVRDGTSPMPTPEPGTLLLLVSGLAGLVGASRRRGKRG